MIESQNWTAYNRAAVEEKRRFVVLLSDLCRGVPQPEQIMGRPRLPLSDMLFSAVYKVYVGFSSRRFTSDLRDAFVEGYIDHYPAFQQCEQLPNEAGAYGHPQESHHN
jgi:hypothetical protein